MLRRSHVIVLILLLTVAAVAAVYTAVVRERAIERERDEAQAALFSEEATKAFTNLDGAAVDITGAEGEVVVATTWASWCPQCAGELQLLNDITVERNDSRVRVLALNRMEPKHQAQRFIATLPALTNITFVLDNADHFFTTVDGYAMPETIFYNPAGEIVFHKRGNLTKEEVQTALDTALASE